MKLNYDAFSPLRYPGGKKILSRWLYNLLKINNLNGCIYAEPFAGGAGLALFLLIKAVLKIIKIFQTDIYQNALLPVILAHKHASISLKPGGKMLDILSKQHCKK